ncbi:MAG: YggS family pyridoxal phosphate-dependent enzyme [Deltaproteobacteria bacterium]|nr:YggS family pyridoxal phosphate-dependent enzyme [Deltaproteobacteria bacterium]
MTDTVARRLEEVRARIDRACREAGRDPAEVRLVAVSKAHPAQAVREALAAGQVDFGESYAQELRDKAAELGVGPSVGGTRTLPVWHFLGPLQRNKVRLVVGTAVLVHAVDSERLGRAIQDRSLPRRTPVLVEVNVGGEPTKHGVDPGSCLDLCRVLHGMPGLDLKGLMCIPPATDDPTRAARFFRLLADLAAEGRARGLPLESLSMGMSQDFEVAVACGATHVRVGTAIFGERS